jgi:N-methylhydantoinase A
VTEPLTNSGSDSAFVYQSGSRLGVDTGGTFTDFALLKNGQLHTHKVLSTPEAPEQAILQGIAEMGLKDLCRSGQLLVVHGSTVATNAALQNRGAKTLFITNQGIEDILSIGRQNRPDIYDLTPPPIFPPVPASQCLGVACRLDKSGAVTEALGQADIDQLILEIESLKPESIALCLLFSYLNPEQEQAIQSAIPEKYFVSISSEVLPESGEYERGIATWLNASLGPLMHSYLSRLNCEIPPENLSVMQSSGGTISCTQAANKAAHLLLSGPAGGLAAAHKIKQEIGCEGLLTFDMGGTSTDVAQIKEQIQLTSEGRIGRYPVAVPMVDMRTIGAGGGSIAYLDEGGMLHVGPESAGANPGPAGYGLGGLQVTVTDAHIFLGNLQPKLFAGGSLTLHKSAATTAIQDLAEKARLSAEQLACGILDLVNEHMARALRQISAERGEDPADFSLCSFGGAGGLHVCALAEKLGMTKAIIPNNAGILSALGMLLAPGKRDLSHALIRSEANTDSLAHQCAAMSAQGQAELLQEGFAANKITTRFSLDCRYMGQSFSLNLPFVADVDLDSLAQQFHVAHKKNFGYHLDKKIELVNLRAHVTAQLETIELPYLAPDSEDPEFELADIYRFAEHSSGRQKTPVFDRSKLAPSQEVTGPALICEDSSTSWVAKGWIARVHRSGHLMLSRI